MIHFALKPVGGTWTDVSFWVLEPDRISESRKAYGVPDSLDIDVYAQRAGVVLGFTPNGGTEYMLWDDVGPDYLSYGVVRRRVATETPENKIWHLTCDSIMRRLKKHVPFIQFDGAVETTDQSRFIKLFNTYMPGVDATSLCQVNTTYGAGLSGFYRTNMKEVIDNLATYKGQATDAGYPVPPRIWRIVAQWVNPANITLGVTVYFDYYSSTQAPIAYPPLTDSADLWANYVADDFDRANSTTAIGTATTAQSWGNVNGVFGINGNQAYIVSGSTDSMANIYSGPNTNEGEISMKVQVQQSGIGVAARTAGSGTSWTGWEIVNNGGTNYLFRKKTGIATYTTITTIAVSPGAGDILKIKIAAGNVITPYVNGTAYGGTTDALNNTSVFHGIVGNGTGVGRYNDFRVRNLAASYEGETWEHDVDWSNLIQKMAIQGPGADAAPIKWSRNVLCHAGGTDEGSLIKDGPGNAWQTGHLYAVDEVVTSIVPNGVNFHNFIGGTSHPTTEPTWNMTEGGITNDGNPSGTVQWKTFMWDASAWGETNFSEDGGYIETTIDNRQVTYDQFTRSDHTSSLLSTPEGYQWRYESGVWGQINLQARLFSGSARAKALLDIGMSTCTYSVKFPVHQAGAGIIFRYKNAANYWFIKDETTTWRLYKRVNNVETAMGSTGIATANNDIVKVVLRDGNIDVYTNNVFRFTVTDSFSIGSCTVGLLAYAGTETTARFDDVLVESTYTTRIFGFQQLSIFQPTFASVEFAFYFDSVSQVRVLESNIFKTSPISYAIGDQFRIEMRQENQGTNSPMIVKYFKNDVLIYTSATNPVPTTSNPYQAAAVLYHYGATISGATGRRFTYNVFTNATSIAEWGDNDNYWVDMLRDDTLDTYAKRKDRWDQISAVYGEPQNIFSLKTFTKYTAGQQVAVNNGRIGWVDQMRMISEVQTDRSMPNNPLYTVILGDSYVELGDDGVYPFLKRGIGDDNSRPPTPTGLALTSNAVRDTATTVNQEFRWNQTTGDEQIIKLRVQNQRTMQAVIVPAPASAHTWVVGRLEPSTLHAVQIQAVDFNGHESVWSQPVYFVTIGLPTLGPPTITGEAWKFWDEITGRVEIAWNITPPSDPNGLGLTGYKWKVIQGAEEVGGIIGVLTLFIALITPTSSAYTLRMWSIDGFGRESATFAEFTAAFAPPLPNNRILNPSFEVPDRVDPTQARWWQFLPNGSASGIRDNTQHLEGAWSYKLVHGTGGAGEVATVNAQQVLLPGGDGDAQSIKVRALGLTGGEILRINLLWQYEDGTPAGNRNIDLAVSTSWDTYELIALPFGGVHASRGIVSLWENDAVASAKTIWVDSVEISPVVNAKASGYMTPDYKKKLDNLNTTAVLTNKSGGSVALGDVVIIDKLNDAAFTTTTTLSYVGGYIGIAMESIANNATGLVLTSGYAPIVNCAASITRGNFLGTNSAVKQAASLGSSDSFGAFGQAITGGTSTPAALIWGMPHGAVFNHAGGHSFGGVDVIPGVQYLLGEDYASTAYSLTEPTSDTSVKRNDGSTDMSVAFSLAGSTSVLVKFKARYNRVGDGSAGRTRFVIKDGSTVVMPDVGGRAAWDGWWVLDDEHHIDMEGKVALGSGSHTLKVYHQGAYSLPTVQFWERYLTAEVKG